MRVASTLGLLLVALAPTGARGGDVWLDPEPALVADAGSRRVGVRLLDAGAPRPFGDGSNRLQRIWRGGRQNLRAAEGGVARFRVEEPGTQLLVWGDGVRFCKAFVVAGRPAEGGQLHLSEVGHRLEIVPQTDPVALLQGVQVLEVQLLFEREPLAFATVEAVPRGAPQRAVVRARTDEIGLAELRLGGVGAWLIRAGQPGATGEGGVALASTLLVTRQDGW